MFDIKWIINHPEQFNNGLSKRRLNFQADTIIQLDKERRHAQQKAQEIQSKRNSLSKKIGEAKANKENVDDMLAEVSESKKAQLEAERVLAETERKVIEILSEIPNLPLKDVPEGVDENDNVEVSCVGDKPTFAFQPKEHFELGEDSQLMDFDVARKISGSRFVILRGDLARLERALSNFMLDLHTQKHYTGFFSNLWL